MFIPDNESNTNSYHFSRRTFLFFIFFISILIFAAVSTIAYYVPKISDYLLMKDQYNQFVSERMKILDLSRDLERIRQMDDLIRSSLGSTLNINERPIITDSLSGIFETTNNISYVDNIPSFMPISGFVSQNSNNPGLFVKKLHNGIDIVAKEGEPILAAASGVVVFSGWTYEFGNMIILYHGDDYFTHYGHNKQNTKQQLDIVERGEVIGLVGSTGISTGPHLHFEVWREFVPMDPFIFFPEYNNFNLTSLNE